MKSHYYDTPNVAVAANYKVGSATLARAIIAAHHPALEAMLTTPPGTEKGTTYPPGVSADDLRWHCLCPTCQPEDRESTLLLVRDPIKNSEQVPPPGKLL
jgi:hypothetical protein